MKLCISFRLLAQITLQTAPLIFVIFFFSVSWLSLPAQSCNDEMALVVQEKWSFLENTFVRDQPGLTSDLIKAIFQNTDNYKQLFINAYPNPFGGMIRGYASIPALSVYDLAFGKFFQYQVDYFGYHCDSKKIRLVTEKEYLSISNARIQANHLGAIMDEVDLPFQLEGKEVKLFRLAHRVEGATYPLTFHAFGNENRVAFLFTHEHSVPFRFITQREYLQMIRQNLEGQLNYGLAAIDEAENTIKEMINETNKEPDSEIRQMMLKELNSQLEQYQARKILDRNNLSSGMQTQLDSIDHYLKSAPESELKKPAIPVAIGVHLGFTTEKDGGHQLVILDEKYLKRNLPASAAQCLVLLWDHIDSDPGAVLWREAMETKFPFENLRNLLDK